MIKRFTRNVPVTAEPQVNGDVTGGDSSVASTPPSQTTQAPVSATVQASPWLDNEPVVKSPPEPTRVKSPEQMIMRSPEPVNWTVPLDTGKTFTVTQNVREGERRWELSFGKETRDEVAKKDPRSFFVPSRFASALMIDRGLTRDNSFRFSKNPSRVRIARRRPGRRRRYRRYQRRNPRHRSSPPSTSPNTLSIPDTNRPRARASPSVASAA